MINNIVLSVINDGDGSSCGVNYAKRVKAARCHDLAQFRIMARRYNNFAVREYGSKIATSKEVIEAGEQIFKYYENHVKEVDNYHRKNLLNAVSMFEKALKDAAEGGFIFEVDLSFIKNSKQLKMEE